MMGNNIRDVKEVIAGLVKRNPNVTVKRLISYLKVPIQTVRWLAEDLNLDLK